MAGATLSGVTGTVTFTGNIPTISNAGTPPSPQTGVITFTGNQALVSYQSLEQAVWHELPPGWYADVGYAARFVHWNIGLPTQNRDSIATFDYQPTTGVVTFTGNVASVALNIDRSPTTGQVQFTGEIATIGLTTAVTASTGLVTFTGNQPSLNTQSLSSPATGTITFTGYVPTINLAVNVSPTTGLINFLSQTPSINTQETKVQPQTGTVTFTGNRPTYTGAINSLDFIAERPAGGWLRKKKKNWYESLPTPEEVETERVALGILPKKVQKVIKETVSSATESVDEKQAALLAAAYLEETQQRNLFERLRSKVGKSKTDWTDEMFMVARTLILDALSRKADSGELERLLMQQEHEEVEANEILELWMEEL
jgi:hypothetical protein